MVDRVKPRSPRRLRAARVIVAAACLAGLALPSEGRAGGLEIPDLGTVAGGRGAAFTARADNLSAFYYNPAGLPQRPDGNVLISVNLVNPTVRYQRQGSGLEYDFGTHVALDPAEDHSEGSGQSRPFEEVSLQKRLGPGGMLVASWGDVGGVDGLAIAAGVIPPSGFGGPAYDPDGAQRYNLIEADSLIVYPGAGVAYRVNRYFSIGGVFLSGIGMAKVRRKIRPVPVRGDTIDFNEDAAGDATLGVDVIDTFMPTGIIGVMSNPIDALGLGVSVRLPVKMEASGTLNYEAPPVELQDSSLVAEPNSVTLRQNLPTMLRAGVRYIHSRFDLELDVVWEDWSVLQTVDLEIDAALDRGDGSAPTALPDNQVLRRFRDTMSFRLGSDIEAVPGVLTVRAGGYYQSSAYPRNYETMSLDFPWGEQFGLSAGLTWHASPYFDLSAGYTRIIQRTVLVTQGIVQQSGLLFDVGEGQLVNIGNTVNNGLYRVGVNLFGLSGEIHFGPRIKAQAAARRAHIEPEPSAAETASPAGGDAPSETPPATTPTPEPTDEAA